MSNVFVSAYVNYMIKFSMGDIRDFLEGIYLVLECLIFVMSTNVNKYNKRVYLNVV